MNSSAMSESELSASSRASSRASSATVATAARGRRRGRKSKANSISAPTQAKLLAVPGEDKPEPVGVLEETALSSLEMPVTTAATAAADAADADDVIFVAPAPPAAATRCAADVPGADAAVVVDAPAAVPVRSSAPTRCLDRIVKGGADGVLEEVGKIKEDFVGLVTDSVLNSFQAMELMRCINRYDGIVQALMVRNAVLEETSRLRATMSTQMPSAPVAVVNRPPVGYASAYPSLPVPSAAPVPAPRKPRDTWSAVVSSKDPKLTGKEVAEKVRREIAPTLGVRLHEVRGLARGGAIIRTPSSGEIKRVVASRKFGEIGLEVKPNTAQLPKLIVQDVATQIAPEEFMEEFGTKDALPDGMRMYTDRRGKAAILVDHQDVICMPMEPLTTDYGVCVSVKGSFGSIFLCSVYCQCGAELEPYLRYMDAVLLQANSTPAILGLDANAVSPMWFSKLPRYPGGHANLRRGELLSEWMLENETVVLNQPSTVFTFDTYYARSDIDVTIANDAASMWATFEWRVDEWELCDHNMITVVATPTTPSTVESLAPVPSWNISNARWQLFEQEMVRRAADIPEDFSQSPLDQQVSTLRSMVHD
ncbi:hypothetical protein KR026_006902, partial [Drosophila bipectinata]